VDATEAVISFMMFGGDPIVALGFYRIYFDLVNGR